MAAGFGAVFGTPVAGAIFALEVSGPGRLGLPLRSLLFCLLAAVIADRTVAAWNIEHTAYVLASVPQTVRIGSVAEILLLTKTAAAAIAFGIAARLFIQMTDAVRSLLKRLRVPAWLRPAIGGTAVLVLTFLVGDRSYLGLGVTANPISPGGVSIQTSFAEGGAGWLSWWWKLAFTALTVGSGFKGGEVTPLFFIGAALGNMLSGVLGLPVSYLAALGFTAVFAAAARTPLACTIMAVELFAPANPGLLSTNFLVAVALCAFLAARFSGRHGLYGDVAAGE
jgi:H+/Cl- antiporter ClcA